MDRRLVFFLAVAVLVIVGGAMLLIGVLRGDDTSVDPNGVNSAPTADDHRAAAVVVVASGRLDPAAGFLRTA